LGWDTLGGEDNSLEDDATTLDDLGGDMDRLEDDIVLVGDTLEGDGLEDDGLEDDGLEGDTVSVDFVSREWDRQRRCGESVGHGHLCDDLDPFPTGHLQRYPSGS
jgi:hypothetical protein